MIISKALFLLKSFALDFSLQDISENHFFFIGSCSGNQECVPITKCPLTKQLNKIIKFISNEEEKETLQELINSRICGGPLAETVCCDTNKGKKKL